MNRFLIASFLLFFALLNCAQAQNEFKRSLDSLHRLLRQKQPDSTKAKIYYGLSFGYRGTDSVKALLYANKCLEIQKKLGSKTGEAKAYFALAYVNLGNQNFDKAEKYFNESLNLVKDDTTIRGIKIRNSVLGSLSYIMGIKGFPQKELDLLLKVLPDMERIKDSSSLGIAYHNIGIKFINMKEQKKAYPYLVKSIFWLKNTKLLSSLGTSYVSLALCLADMDSLPQAKNNLDQSKLIFEKTQDADEWTQYHTAYGQYLYASKRYNEAIESYNEAMELAKRKNQWYRMDDIQEGKYQVYLAQKDYASCKKTLQEYYESNLKRQVHLNQLNGLKNLAFIEEKLGNNENAFQYLKRYQQLSDSIKEEQVKVKINELEEKYQASEKEKQILQLKNTTKQQQLDIQRSKFIFYILMGGIAFLLVLLLLSYKVYKHKNNLVKQKEQLHQQKLKELEQEKQLTVYSAMLEGQEQERKRLARDLHDGLGGALAGIKLQLSKIAGNTQPGFNDAELHKTIGQLDHSIHDLRCIARNLMPESLLRFGLEAALKDLCESMSNSQTKVFFQSYNLSRSIPQNAQLMVYRIIQELITNGIKYAEAKQILVQCFQECRILQITVEDDGKGFDPLKPTKGVGLISVQNRVDYLKGHLEINSQPSIGTTVNIELEINETSAKPGDLKDYKINSDVLME